MSKLTNINTGITHINPGITQINPGKFTSAGDRIPITPIAFTTSASYKINPAIFLYRPIEITNILDRAPTDNPYPFNGKKYALPRFRIKPQDLDSKGAIRMVKENDKIFLRVVLQAYRDEADVVPLDFRSVALSLRFHSEKEAREISQDFKVTQSVYINQTNILKDIHAELEITENYLPDILAALTNTGYVSRLVISADVWWQKPTPESTRPRSAMDPMVSIGTIRPSAAAIISNPGGKGTVISPNPNVILKPIYFNIQDTAGDKPTRIDVNSSINLKFREDDDLFYLFGELMSKKYKWEYASKTVFGELLTIYYRRTRSEFRYKFLPQTFRLALDDAGGPRVRLSLWEKDKNPANDLGQYQIALECNLLPYVHPNARKDLMNRLFVEERKKYVDPILEFGGHGQVFFVLAGGFRSLFTSLGGKEIYIGDKKLDLSRDNVPVAINPEGFNLTFITTLGSFGDLRRRFEEGNVVGEIMYEFEADTYNTQSIATGKSNGIPVEVNLAKFTNLSLAIDKITELAPLDVTDPNSQKVNVPRGIRLKNNLPFAVSLGGLDMTILCKVGEEIYDHDMTLSTERKDYPLTIGSGQVLDLKLEEASIKDLLGRNLFWTDLDCSPYGLKYETDTPQVMARIIDYANTESIPWQLKVEYPFDWDQNLRVITIAITDMEEKMAPQTVQLKPGETEKTITVAKTLDQYLKTAQGFNRQYKYKRRFLYSNGTSQVDHNWNVSSDFESEFLTVSPAPVATE